MEKHVSFDLKKSKKKSPSKHKRKEVVDPTSPQSSPEKPHATKQAQATTDTTSGPQLSNSTTPTLNSTTHTSISTIPTVAVPFVPRNPESSAFFMPLLTSGRDSDFKIALHDTQNGYIAVHSLILKTRSDYFDHMFNSNMKEVSERWTSFVGYGDKTMMDALECIYSCSIEHMRGCEPQELADLICFLGYIDYRGSDAISALFTLAITEITCEHVERILIVLEQVITQGMINLIPQKSLRKAHKILAEDLIGNDYPITELEAEALEAYCKLDEHTLASLLEEALKKFKPGYLLPIVLNFIAVWTSYNPNHRIPHTIKLLKSKEMFISEQLHPYTIQSGEEGALSMVHSLELDALLPEHMATRPQTSELLLCQLENTLLRLNRDALMVTIAGEGDEEEEEEEDG